MTGLFFHPLLPGLAEFFEGINKRWSAGLITLGGCAENSHSLPRQDLLLQKPTDRALSHSHRCLVIQRTTKQDKSSNMTAIQVVFQSFLAGQRTLAYQLSPSSMILAPTHISKSGNRPEDGCSSNYFQNRFSPPLFLPFSHWDISFALQWRDNPYWIEETGGKRYSIGKSSLEAKSKRKEDVSVGGNITTRLKVPVQFQGPN